MSRLLAKYQDRDETELWKEYKASKNAEIRSYLAEKYSPLVKHVAGKVAIGMPQNVEFEDLVSYGVFGLLDAIDKFDPKREIKFKTYAMTRIRGSIFDELRSIDWIPRSIRQKAKQYEQIMSMLENKEGHKPSDEEIAKELGLSTEDFNSLINKLSSTTLVSLNDIWFLGDENDEISIMETLESPMNLNPDNIIEKEEIKNVIVDAIKTLPEKEMKVIVLYYYEDLTLKEIGEVLEVTESRISQLHTKAVARLRSKLAKVKSVVSKK
jgi:RNA polymerase sigma factor for flagellar operon FliA